MTYEKNGLSPAATGESPKSKTDFGYFLDQLNARNASASQSKNYPVSALPPELQRVLGNCAQLTRTCPELTGPVALGAISVAVGSSVSIQSGKHRKTWANLFTMIAAPPGSGKGEAFRALAGPIMAADKRKRTEWVLQKGPEFLAKRDRLQALRRYFMRETDPETDMTEELALIHRALWELEEDYRSPGFLSEDSTSEALAADLKAAGGTCGSISAEAGRILQIIGGRYQSQAQTDDNIFCKGYSGETIRISRRNLPFPLIVDQPCLSILWATQPHRVSSFFSSQEIRSGGLGSRFLLSLPEISYTAASENEFQLDDADPAIDGVLELWSYKIEQLLSLRGSDPKVITPSSGAIEVLCTYDRYIENELSLYSEEMRGLFVRQVENAWRICVVLHCFLHSEHPNHVELCHDTAIAAVDISEFHRKQIQNLISGEQKERCRTTTEKMIEAITASGGAITERELRRQFTIRSEIAQEVARTSTHIVRDRKATPGRPSFVYRLNETSRDIVDS